MVAYSRKRKATTTIFKGRVAKKPRLTKKTVASIAKKAVMKAVETKKHSFEVTEAIVSTNSAVNVGNPIALAATPGHGGRIGHKVNPIGLDIRGHMVAQPTTSAVIAKIMVVRYKDMNASPTTDLLETNAGNVTAASNDVSKLYRRINTDAFDVLATKYLNLAPLFNGGKTCKMFRMWVPLRRLRQLVYEGTGSISPTYNDINILVFAADADNDATLLTELSYNSTFYYKDP